MSDIFESVHDADSVEEAKLKKRAGSGWSSACSFGYGIPAYGCRTDQLAAEAQRAREESQYLRQFLNSARNPGRKRRAAMPPFKIPEVDE